jgi:GNAT superfamily N-acetyltransferase
VTAARLMREEDVPAVHELMSAAFGDLDRRLGSKYAGPQPQLAQSRIRFGRALATDPGGSWVAERDGRIAGCVSSILREGVWGLSMFIVDPAAQGTGIGRELLARAAAYGDGARGRIILASRDPRAITAYARMGLDLEAALNAGGTPRGLEAGDVRPGTAADLPLTEAVDRAVRGAAHGEDILAMVAGGADLLVAPGRGYAVVLGGNVRLLAAFDDEGAAAVLRGAIAHAATKAESVNVEWLTARQPWATAVCLEAGLQLSANCGPVFTGGDVGPFRPYLPSGSYL